MLGRLIVIGAAGLLALAGTAMGSIEGRYDVIGKVPAPHSLNTVLFEEYLNFTCPHCNNFLSASKPLFAKYGKRLKRVVVPILFRGQSDAPLRLFFIAQREGRGDEIERLIFDATFKYGVNINDPSVVNYLARTAGLGSLYQKEASADWVSRKVQEAQVRAQVAGVQATPTVVLQGALRITPQEGMQAYINNLDHLVAQLLK